MTALVERNPLVASGEFERVFVCEVEPGAVTPFGEVVDSVKRVANGHVRLVVDGHHRYYRADSTILVEVRP